MRSPRDILRKILLSSLRYARRSREAGRRCNAICAGRLAYIFILFFLLVPFVWAVPMQQVSYGEQKVAQEYELKAVYLYNFLQFIQWPESQRMLSKDGSMVIGIVGESPFGEAFEELQATIRKNGLKPVRVIYYGSYREGLNMRHCHILFVSASEKRNFAKITAELRGLPVLTVADTGDFLSSGGMINLVQSDGKIRWMINRSQANEAGLRFSAQLLTLAVRVMGD
jgi:hypothetical protein